MSKKYWLLPLISGVAMAFAFLGDYANKLADEQVPLVLADSPGIKPGGTRPGRP